MDIHEYFKDLQHLVNNGHSIQSYMKSGTIRDTTIADITIIGYLHGFSIRQLHTLLFKRTTHNKPVNSWPISLQKSQST